MIDSIVHLMTMVTLCLIGLKCFDIDVGKILIGMNNKKLKDRLDVLELRNQQLALDVEKIREDQEFLQRLLENKG